MSKKWCQKNGIAILDNGAIAVPNANDELLLEKKKALLQLVENVNKKTTNVKAEVKDGSVIVYNVDADGNKTTPFHEATQLVKQTGSTDTMAIIASISLVIVLIGTILVSKEIKANN